MAPLGEEYYVMAAPIGLHRGEELGMKGQKPHRGYV